MAAHGHQIVPVRCPSANPCHCPAQKNRLPLVAAGVQEDTKAIRDGVEAVLAEAAYRKNITRLADAFATYHAEERCAGYIT